jgi:hypothetical protein
MNRRHLLLLLSASLLAAVLQPARAAAPASLVLSDRELFDALDLSLPALAPLRAAIENNAADSAPALAALGKYLRDRPAVNWGFDPRKPDRAITFNRAGADNGAAGHVKVVTIPFEFPGGQIDWSFNATTASADLPDNNEWQLNRMGWWSEMGRAYEVRSECPAACGGDE